MSNKARGFADGQLYYVDRDWYGRLRSAFILAAQRGADKEKLIKNVGDACLKRAAIERAKQ